MAKNYNHKVTKELIASKGMTMTGFAKKAGISQGNASSLISKGRATWEKIVQFGKALDIPPHQLLASETDILAVDESLKCLAKEQIEIHCPCCGMPLHIHLECGVPKDAEIIIKPTAIENVEFVSTVRQKTKNIK